MMESKLLDPVRLCTVWPRHASAAHRICKTYCSIRCKPWSQKNGVRLTMARSTAKDKYESDGVACNAVRMDFLPIAEPVEIQEEKLQIDEEAIEMKKWIEKIKMIFGSMEDGEISISPYDTAWIALVPGLDGSGKPQFPSSLKWIIDHQLTDGSWGDPDILHLADRILNTLACVIAVKAWNTVPQCVTKGLNFLRTYIPRMEEDDDFDIPIGFEIVFPSLMEDAKAMNLDLPYDGEFLQKMYDQKASKLERIPMEVVHKNSSTLLHSLEGLRDMVDWNELLKLQCKDGSFLFSPASTACAFAQTKNANCLRYLENVTEKFNGGAPNVYPVDLFEHLWMVDRLERLGISRYFQKEITDSLEYVYRYWTSRGIGWARDSPVQDVDDTSMAFRLFRLHGFDVTTEAFSHFKQGDHFICFPGESSQAVTGMYNLHRASQVLFPCETILEEAQTYTRNFLRNRRAKNQIRDKWIISKGLAGEVEYALDFPWYASQPRIETRLYIEQYGVDDVWIGKLLYRMPFVNNEVYIKLAKADFNLCQSIHRKELKSIIWWSRECRFDRLRLVQEDTIVRLYFLAAIALFEPEVAPARLAWAHSAIAMTAVRNLFSQWHSSPRRKQHFMEAFERWDVTAMVGDGSDTAKQVLRCLFRMIHLFSVDGGVVQGRNISSDLKRTWRHWLVKEAHFRGLEEDEEEENIVPEAEVMVMSASYLAGETISRDLIRHPEFTRMMKLTNRVCSLLRPAKYSKGCDNVLASEQEENVNPLKLRADEAMRDLVGLPHGGQSPVPSTVKRLCLSVSKSFYYAAHCKNQEMADHVDMLLFHSVV